MKRLDKIFTMLCVYFILITLYMKYGKVRPYCDLCQISETLQTQIIWSNGFFYLILFHLAFALNYLFHYSKNAAFLTKIGAIAGFIYFILWIPFDIGFFLTDLPGQVKLMQSEHFAWVYSIVIFLISLACTILLTIKLFKKIKKNKGY